MTSTRGMTEVWETRFFRLGTLRSCGGILVYTAALPVPMSLGPHLFMQYAVKNCDHLGKIPGDMGIVAVRERPYGVSS